MIVAKEYPPSLAVNGIDKTFGSVHALKGVDFDLIAGEIHALLGANGAGKSTLARVISGQIRPDAGRMLLDGRPLKFLRPRDALDAGIGVVTQETNLAGHLPVWENIVLPAYGTKMCKRRSELRDSAQAALERLGFSGDIALDEACQRLSQAQRQMVEIARAVALESRVIIFDEPTAALSPSETERLFQVMTGLKAKGCGMIFVSHRLEEIFSITDRITVLRDGRNIGPALATATTDQATLVHLMVGREVAPIGRAAASDAQIGRTVLRVDGLNDGNMVRHVSFDVSEGEIVGLGGLVGSGRSEVAELVMGLRPMISGGMELAGKPFHPGSPAEAIRSGLAFLPEDRRRQSIVPDFSVRENIVLPFLNQSRGVGLGYDVHDARIVELAALIELSTARLNDENLLNFSGGMQQKALFIRALLPNPKLLILDEPTRGVDIASRSTIYALLRLIAGQGAAILLISSDFEELLGLSTRIVPISDGRSLGSIPSAMLDEEQLVLLAAPRSSMASQQRLLDQIAAAQGADVAWLIEGSEDRVLCLASTVTARAGSLPTQGTVSRAGQTAMARCLATASGMFVTEADGRVGLCVSIENARSHDMGRITLLYDFLPADSVEEVNGQIDEMLDVLMERRFRCSSRSKPTSGAVH